MISTRRKETKNQFHKVKPGKWVARLIIFFLIGLGFGSGVVSAEYLGPDRTYQVTEYEACEYGVWVHTAAFHECKSADGSWAEACIDCGWECNPGWSCGNATYSYVLGTRLVEHIVTHTDPEATVSSVTNCTAWGDASWCTQPASLSITGTEPMPVDQIILIEGTRNGEPFACPAVTCTVPMLEGSNALTFWAISTYGDSSRMGTLTVLQDTQAPQISAGISGIAGDNGWFVSDAVLSVAYSDAVPGSGISSTSALINGTLTDVSTPVTLPEGVYTIQLDVRDGAGLTAQVNQTAWVDTTAPALSANQPPPESGVYMNGNVAFTGTSSDATSGVNRIEVAPDGVNWAPATLNPDGSWNLNWDSSVKPDDTYTPRVASTDNAGNRTEISLQPITLDNSAPAMSITGAWYIWETGHASVRDTRSGIEHIELSVRDDQNRWPATGWQFETDHLEYDINWNRQFEDGTWAPTGSYQVLLQAWDRLGNGRYITGRIYIPGAGETPVITSQGMISVGVMEETPQPTVEGTPAALAAANTLEPAPGKTPASFTFSSVPVVPETGGEESSPSSPLVDPNLLWGASAAAAALAATAYALSRKEEKEAERKRQEEQSLAEANAKVAASEATKTANYMAKCQLEEVFGIPITADIVACSAGLKGLYQNIVNTILGNPTEEIDEDLLSEIGNDLTRYFNDQPIENGAQTAPASVSWSEFVSTPVGPTLDDAPTAVDYSNLVSLFNQGEAASNVDYGNNLAEGQTNADTTATTTSGIGLLANLINAISPIAQAAQDNLKGFIANTLNFISPTAQSIQNNLQGSVANAINSISPIAQNIQDNLKISTANTLNTISPIVQSILNNIKNSVVNAINTISPKAQTFQNELKESGAGFLNNASNGLAILHDIGETAPEIAVVATLNNSSAFLGDLHDSLVDGEYFVYTPEKYELWKKVRGFVPSIDELMNKEIFPSFDVDFIVYNGWVYDVGFFAEADITTIGTGENVVTGDGYDLTFLDIIEIHKDPDGWSVSVSIPRSNQGELIQGVEVEKDFKVSYVVDNTNKLGPKIDLRIGEYSEYTSISNQSTVEDGFLIRTNNTRRVLATVLIPVVVYIGIVIAPTVFAYLGELIGGGTLIGKLGELGAALQSFWSNAFAQ